MFVVVVVIIFLVTSHLIPITYHHNPKKVWCLPTSTTNKRKRPFLYAQARRMISSVMARMTVGTLFIALAKLHSCFATIMSIPVQGKCPVPAGPRK